MEQKSTESCRVFPRILKFACLQPPPPEAQFLMTNRVDAVSEIHAFEMKPCFTKFEAVYDAKAGLMHATSAISTL